MVSTLIEKEATSDQIKVKWVSTLSRVSDVYKFSREHRDDQPRTERKWGNILSK